MTKLHESSIQEILKNVQSYSQAKIASELDNYNEMFNSELSSTIQQNKDMVEKQNTTIRKILDSINQYNSNLQNSLRASKVNCRNIFDNFNKK
jgi:methyl-accepting chemotaxis protein